MRHIYLLLLFVLLMSTACQPQKSTVETQQNSNKPTKPTSGEPTSAENFGNQNLANANQQKSNSAASGATKSGQVFENECYSFDAGGLKPDNDRKTFQYPCESAFNLDDDSGYFPTLVVREYTYEQSSLNKKFHLDEKFNLADAVRRNLAEAEKAGYTIKTSSINLAGAPAERLDVTFTCPDNQTVTQNSNSPQSRKPTEKETTRCKPGSTEKAYSIIVDPTEKLGDAGRNRKIPGFYLGGRLNKPEQDIILQQVIKSWRWK